MRNELTGEQERVRWKRYFYDGARRIQEIVAEFSPVSGGGSGGTGTFADIGMPDEIGSVTGEWNPGLLVHDLRVDREYVYVPSAASGGGGYVDEFIGQFDRYGDPWWILQDANFNVLAMTDADGDVARQVMYDPYGEPLFAEDFGAHPGLKIGHQGLFFDRLELPSATSGSVSLGGATQLEPGVFGLYQTRNRVLLSRYGRWGQADPNGTGSLTSMQWEGKNYLPNVVTDPPSFDMVLVDGSNRFASVESNPINNRDPMGLSIDSFMPDPSDLVTGVLESLVRGYAENLEFDIEWALDWSMPDDDYSRTDNGWINFAIAEGLYNAFEIGIPGTDIGFNPLDAFVSGTRRSPDGPSSSAPPTRRSRGGETPHTIRGREKNKQYYEIMEAQGCTTRHPIKGGEIDAIHFEKRIIYEYKPASPSGRYKGWRQLLRYKAVMEETTGIEWYGIWHTYAP